MEMLRLTADSHEDSSFVESTFSFEPDDCLCYLVFYK